MLKKLLKYDFINIYKFLIIFYSLAIFFGILTRIFFEIENSFIINLIAQICSGVTISMIVNILINNVMRLWVRFKNNFYGDESYLTHTLPIDKKTQYLSKFITSIVSMFTSVFVIGITLFIAYYSKENVELLKNILLPIAELYNSSIIYILIAFLFIFFLEIANILQSGYSGIIIGHKMNNNKTLFSVIFGFIVYIGTQLLVLITIFLFALFNKDLMNLFITNQMVNLDMVKMLIYMSIIIYVVDIIICYIVNIKLLKNGVDVE